MKAPDGNDFVERVGIKARSRRRARRRNQDSIWFGLGTLGMVGWTVVVPTLLGAAAGIWLDSRYRGPHSWTLMLLALGLILGCIQAWRWVSTEQARTFQENDDGEEDADDAHQHR